jgi:2',3'-cyclic-nucleotide 2'-phosphodiesterase (5'-nucleotidase family)
MSRTFAAAVAAALLWVSCGSPAQLTAPAAPPTLAAPPSVAAVAPRAPITLSLIGTNDLHGALARLPIFAGYINNLRKVRAADGGAVLLVDGGDMFQGTLESNTAEGADVVAAYNALGYAAAAVGNHEFDFGPVGPAVTIKSPDEDPRGALKARAAEATFPLLMANVLDASTQQLVTWPNVLPATKVTVAGVTVGIIGLATDSTPFTTMPANFIGLQMAEPALAAIARAKQLRAEGATVIVIAAHIGSKCKDFHDPDDNSSCDHDEEIFKVVEALPGGLVDVVVAGHTHAGMAHRINGVAVIESYASARAFGRVDLTVDAAGKVTATSIRPPTDLCPPGPNSTPMPAEQCQPGPYEGLPVERDPAISAIVAAAFERTRARREERLGVTASAAIKRSYDTESALGNWFTDMMLAANPQAQVALTNGGGLRADVPAGDITYGRLFAALPFDNRFALVQLTGRQLRDMVTTNLSRGGAQYSWGGLTSQASCRDKKLVVDIRVGGKPLDDNKQYTMVTSDFLTSGGDAALTRFQLPPTAITSTNVIIRDAFAERLRATAASRKAIDPQKLYDPKAPRQKYEGHRPIVCDPAAAPLTSPSP